MIIEALITTGALLIGRYLIPSKKKRTMVDVAFQRINGTYRDPALYEVVVTYPGKPEKYYKVRNVNEIQEADRTTVVKGFMTKHVWMDNFLNGKDSKEEI